MKITKQPIVLVLLTCLLLLVCNFAYARGGGGHGGGLFSTILYIILLPFLIIYAIIKNKKIKEKSKISEGILQAAVEEDSIWDETQMTTFARDMFFRIQTAWSDHDLSSVKNDISENLYNNYKSQLDFMKARNEKNLMDDIDVRKVTITWC